MTDKSCIACNKELPASSFYVNATKCKACSRMARQKQTNQGGPETYLRRITSQLKSSREKDGFEWDITPGDIIELWKKQGGRCAVSGVLMTYHRDGNKSDTNASIDRINPEEKIYSPGNVMLCCIRVNLMRHNLSMGSFHWWINNIIQQQGNHYG